MREADGVANDLFNFPRALEHFHIAHNIATNSSKRAAKPPQFICDDCLLTCKGQSSAKDKMEVVPRHKLRIIAAGKGMSMSEPAIVDTMVDMLFNGRDPEHNLAPDQVVNMVYLGTASYDMVPRFMNQAHAYTKLDNFRVTKLDVSEAAERVLTAQEIREALSTAHVIMASGGNTLYAVSRWRELGIDDMIRELVMTKTPAPILCGGSAGAICWFDSGHSDSADPSTQLVVNPHLTDEQKDNWDYIR